MKTYEKTGLIIVARTVQDFCRAYGVSRSTTYRLIADGKIDTRRVGDRQLIIEDSARHWFFGPAHTPAQLENDTLGDREEQKGTRRYQRSSKYRHLRPNGG